MIKYFINDNIVLIYDVYSEIFFLSFGFGCMLGFFLWKLAYNWLIGMNALPEGKLKLYYLTGKLWNQRFACKVNDDTQILCIAMGDLNINAENTEQFSYEHMVFGRYLDDIVTGG